MPSSCTFEAFFQNESCTLSHCVGCGGIQLSLGVVTLDLTPEQFEALAGSLRLAQQALSDYGAGQGAPAGTPLH